MFICKGVSIGSTSSGVVMVFTQTSSSCLHVLELSHFPLYHLSKKIDVEIVGRSVQTGTGD